MIRAAVALIASISLLGCFPHDPRKRTFAQIGEGGALVGGIAIAAVAGTGADCDEMAMPGDDTSSCHTKASVLSTIGVALIVGGLLGFVATVSTAEEEKPKPLEIKATPAEPSPTTPTTTQPSETGSTGNGSGSSAAPASGSATPPGI